MTLFSLAINGTFAIFIRVLQYRYENILWYIFASQNCYDHNFGQKLLTFSFIRFYYLIYLKLLLLFMWVTLHFFEYLYFFVTFWIATFRLFLYHHRVEVTKFLVIFVNFVHGFFVNFIENFYDFFVCKRYHFSNPNN